MKKFLMLAALACTVILGACQTAVPPNNYVIQNQNVPLNHLCEKYHVAWMWDNISEIVILNFKNTEARLLVGSDVVMAGGQQIVLSRPVEMMGSQIVVPSDFERRVLEPSFQKSNSAGITEERKFTTVLIDAGHGGHDTGAIARNGMHEKDIVLDVAKRLGEKLEQRGIKIFYTRKNDTFVSLEDRTEFVSRHADADLFVSVHANSARVRGPYGIEVYSLRPLDYESLHESKREANQDLMFSKIPMAPGSRDVENIVSDMLYSHKQRDSFYLARKIAQNTAYMARTKNRGAHEARFFVLRNTLIPAVLVEIGFMSNPKEEQLLETTNHRQQIAEGIAKSILDYARIK
ncbi:MAG: N-acetylmuramoyl-L-alanine amidase [Candidatus Omnitrophica bacterium]|nr:N-acetylmuramoyl-L-alanine amidase [Candidatus Omnitrophota bacterium]